MEGKTVRDEVDETIQILCQEIKKQNAEDLEAVVALAALITARASLY